MSTIPLIFKKGDYNSNINLGDTGTVGFAKYLNSNNGCLLLKEENNLMSIMPPPGDIKVPLVGQGDTNSPSYSKEINLYKIDFFKGSTNTNIAGSINGNAVGIRLSSATNLNRDAFLQISSTSGHVSVFKDNSNAIQAQMRINTGGCFMEVYPISTDTTIISSVKVDKSGNILLETPYYLVDNVPRHLTMKTSYKEANTLYYSSIDLFDKNLEMSINKNQFIMNPNETIIKSIDGDAIKVAYNTNTLTHALTLTGSNIAMNIDTNNYLTLNQNFIVNVDQKVKYNINKNSNTQLNSAGFEVAVGTGDISLSTNKGNIRLECLDSTGGITIGSDTITVSEEAATAMENTSGYIVSLGFISMLSMTSLSMYARTDLTISGNSIGIHGATALNNTLTVAGATTFQEKIILTDSKTYSRELPATATEGQIYFRII